MGAEYAGSGGAWGRREQRGATAAAGWETAFACHRLPSQLPPQTEADAAIAARSLAAFLSSRQAAMLAPNPESMLTTVTPGAELLSAASSGATPPKAVP